jgi:hypothetical protein
LQRATQIIVDVVVAMNVREVEARASLFAAWGLASVDGHFVGLYSSCRSCRQPLVVWTGMAPTS